MRIKNVKAIILTSTILASMNSSLVSCAEIDSSSLISVYSYSVNDSTEVLVASARSFRGEEFKTINICGMDVLSETQLGSFVLREQDAFGNLDLTLSFPAWKEDGEKYSGVNFDIRDTKLKRLFIMPMFDPLMADTQAKSHLVITEGENVVEHLIVPTEQRSDLVIALGDLEKSADSKWRTDENEVLINCKKLFDEKKIR